MSTKYFVLMKSGETVNSNEKDHHVVINGGNVHILPLTNLVTYINNGLFEGNLIEWSKQFCNKTHNFIDIGAHSGTYSISLANNCNNVYAFEPQKMTYYALCGGVALSNHKNVNCVNVALGAPEQVGKSKLNIVSNDGGGSTVLAIDKILKSEDIIIETLDSYKIDNISFIKIDVEGNELNVLKGATKTLEKSNYPPILFESNVQNDELFGFIRSLGYKIISVSGYSNMFMACH